MTASKTLFFDLETESPVDLRETNAAVYFAHPETRLMSVAFAFGEDGEVRSCDQLTGFDEFYDAVRAANTLVAHNAGFDFLGIDVRPTSPRTLRCTMAMSYVANGPGGLADAAKAFNKRFFKQDTPLLIEKQIKSRWKHTKAGFVSFKDAPEAEREQLLAYGKLDVEAMRELYYHLLPIVPETELDYIDAHLRINLRGVPFGSAKIKAAHTREAADKETQTTAFAERFGFLPSNVESIKAFIASRTGEMLPDGQAATLEKLRARTQDEEVKAVIDGRFALTGSNADRFKRIIDRAQAVSEVLAVVRDEFVFAPAVTARYSARGAQMHNCPRGGEARHCVVAPDGYELYTADFAQIELRIGLWLVCEDERLIELHEGALYEGAGAEIFDIPIEQVGKDERQLGKVLYLGGMYQAGAPSFKKFAENNYGIKLSQPRAKELIDQFRKKHKGFVKAWQTLQNAANYAVHHKTTTTPEGTRGVSFIYEEIQGVPALRATLPTGRSIIYWSPRLRKDDRYGGYFFDYTSTRGSSGRRAMHHGGKQLENLAQAVGRDLMARSISKFRDALHPDEGVVLHVHDELVAVVREGRDKQELDDIFLAPEWRTPPGKGGLVLDCESHLTKAWGDAK